MNFAEVLLEASLQNNAPGAWLESGAGLQAAEEAPRCWACFPTQETLYLHKPSPESHSHAFSSLFGCKQLWDYSHPVVSQRLVNSWVQSGMASFLFPLSVFCPELFWFGGAGAQELGMPGCGQFGVDGSPRGWGCGALHCPSSCLACCLPSRAVGERGGCGLSRSLRLCSSSGLCG